MTDRSALPPSDPALDMRADVPDDVPATLLAQLDALIASFDDADEARRALAQLDAREAAGEPLTIVDPVALRETLEAAAKASRLAAAKETLQTLRRTLLAPPDVAQGVADDLETDETEKLSSGELEEQGVVTVEQDRVAEPEHTPVQQPEPEVAAQAVVAASPLPDVVVPNDVIADHEVTLIKGVDRHLAGQLCTLGIDSLSEMAQWRFEDVAEVSEALQIGDRISRENWIEQAAVLAQGVPTAFALKMGKVAQVTPDEEPDTMLDETVEAAEGQDPREDEDPDIDEDAALRRKRREVRRTSFGGQDAATQAAALVAAARERARKTTERVSLLEGTDEAEPAAPKRPVGFGAPTAVPGDLPAQPTGAEASVRFIRHGSDPDMTAPPALDVAASYKDALTGPRVTNMAAPTVDEAAVRIVHRPPDDGSEQPDRLIERVERAEVPVEQSLSDSTQPPSDDYAAYEAEVEEATIRFVPRGRDEPNRAETSGRSVAGQQDRLVNGADARSGDGGTGDEYDRYLGALTGSNAHPDKDGDLD